MYDALAFSANAVNTDGVSTVSLKKHIDVDALVVQTTYDIVTTL